MPYHKDQNLNEWVKMLYEIYGNSQNYNKTASEIFVHLTEVCGAFGKFLFKKNDVDEAKKFLPKIFAWAVALLKQVKRNEADLERLIFTKFPSVCPYCCSKPCKCISGKKSNLDQGKLDIFFKDQYPASKKRVDDYQVMFRAIYENSWGNKSSEPSDIDSLHYMHTRLIEELSEVAETIRFYHLYPSNFDNELADFFAWWFALVTNLYIDPKSKKITEFPSESLWRAYPGFCVVCTLLPCDCRPGPVRELLSKPAINQLGFVDPLTQTGNKSLYLQDMQDIENKTRPVGVPIACIFIDIDNFKNINDNYSHSFGDEAIKRTASVIRKKIRPRDKVYRFGGDEFSVLCQDFSLDEAKGMMQRVADDLRQNPIIYTERGKPEKLIITLSIGIAECLDVKNIVAAFNNADQAVNTSKGNGKNIITIFLN
ncbi:MAG: hypothetical protein COV66_10210 [Nitrospinae bacterium CG11_big_fil_rev_8_21_14_0_20_45_15]|nr:MAG: hypothetical protein COV66_10210 [Nitrospinae bacterium CG11_big_fil_rev_8_21_14_0_20_45_15]